MREGYSRHRADFYIPNERPKKFWLRELEVGDRARLRACELPPECRGALIAAPGGLTLAQHEDGSPQAIAVYDQKEGTQRCEQSAALALLESLPALGGKIVTADPLHCQKKTARAIVEKSGDYLFGIEGNQPTLLAHAEGFDALESPPF